MRVMATAKIRIFVLDEALTALLGGHLILASIRTCCLKGSTDANGFTVAPLDPNEFRDLNIARTEVEIAALRLSIAKGDGASRRARSGDEG